ncbi:MAG: PilZ domain-containing protein, partial [Acidobacteriota bacterium]|nr:PilZ domain-containing protein [Acidobacteriota bacterium]
WGQERRRAPRHQAQREAHLLFIASPLAAEDQGSSHLLIGYTRDISGSGLSLIVTSTHISDYDLCGVDSLLKIKLSLPSGVSELETRVVRHEWLNEDDPRRGYFIGVEITEIKNEDLKRVPFYAWLKQSIQ